MSDALRIMALPFDMEGHRELRLAAIMGERFVGTASVANVDRAAATIYQLYVAKGEQGRGVGTALVEAAELEAARLGCCAVSVLVAKGGPIGFYGGMGYQVVHHEGDTAVMSKVLGDSESETRCQCAERPPYPDSDATAMKG